MKLFIKKETTIAYEFDDAIVNSEEGRKFIIKRE